MNQRPSRVIFVAAVTCVVLLLLAPLTAAAQEVRIAGKVAWIAASTMSVERPGLLPVAVDLTPVDLGDYRDVVAGDQFLVIGRPAADGNGIVAASVQRLGS